MIITANQSILLHFVLHGALILLVSNLAGSLLGRALVSRKSTAEQQEAWRMAHSSSSSFGVFLVAVGAISPFLKLAPLLSQFMLWGLVFSGYGFMLGTTLAAITGHRGLKRKGPIGNYAIHFFYLIGVAGSMIGIPLIIYGCLRGLL